MGFKSLLQKASKILGLSASTGVTDGLLGLASGGIGGAVMSKAGYSSYKAIEGALVGGAGNAVVGGGLGLMTGLAIYSGHHPNVKKLLGGGLTSMVLLQTAGGVIGYELLINTSLSTMSMGEIAADLAIGSGILGAGLSVGLCCCLGVVLCACGPTMVKKLKGYLDSLDKDWEPDFDSPAGFVGPSAELVSIATVGGMQARPAQMSFPPSLQPSMMLGRDSMFASSNFPPNFPSRFPPIGMGMGFSSGPAFSSGFSNRF